MQPEPMDSFQLDQALRAGKLFEQLDEPTLSALPTVCSRRTRRRWSASSPRP